MLARVIKDKLVARAGKYKLGARANKYKLEAKTEVWGQGSRPEPGLKQRTSPLRNIKTQAKDTANASTITTVNSQI